MMFFMLILKDVDCDFLLILHFFAVVTFLINRSHIMLHKLYATAFYFLH